MLSVRSCFFTSKRVPTMWNSFRFLSSQRNSGDFSYSKEEKQTHFGFQNVPEGEKSKKVGEVFHSVADKYDIMNDLMSGGLHRMWKNEFINILNPTPGTVLLDMAGGTGDIAFRFVDAINSSPVKGRKPSEVIVADINPSMLEVGKRRAREQGYLDLKDPKLSWMVADAEKIPLEDNSVDAYTIAFGIRNCTHINQVLSEAYRILKPGGRFLCLEFSHIETFGFFNPPLQFAYDFYSFNFIPVLGQLVAGDKQSYQYLVESIRQFPNQAEFCDMIEREGFSLVNYKNLTFGVVAIHSAFKL